MLIAVLGYALEHISIRLALAPPRQALFIVLDHAQVPEADRAVRSARKAQRVFHLNGFDHTYA
jgi:hypothetical protein